MYLKQFAKGFCLPFSYVTSKQIHKKGYTACLNNVTRTYTLREWNELWFGVVGSGK